MHIKDFGGEGDSTLNSTLLFYYPCFIGDYFQFFELVCKILPFEFLYSKLLQISYVKYPPSPSLQRRPIEPHNSIIFRTL